ncbi:Uncharacterised protein [Segatella copri]|nr:Uncharacterised protein [Segatella copri]
MKSILLLKPRTKKLPMNTTAATMAMVKVVLYIDMNLYFLPCIRL